MNKRITIIVAGILLSLLVSYVIMHDSINGKYSWGVYNTLDSNVSYLEISDESLFSVITTKDGYFLQKTKVATVKRLGFGEYRIEHLDVKMEYTVYPGILGLVMNVDDARKLGIQLTFLGYSHARKL
jgi:hypothetical protein